MDKAALVNWGFVAGTELLHALHKADFPIDLAFWVAEDDEAQSFTFVIATSLVRAKGPLAAYEAFQAAAPVTSVPFSDVELVKPEDPRVSDVRSLIKREGDLPITAYADSVVNPNDRHYLRADISNVHTGSGTSGPALVYRYPL